jgi:hypothetical protein
VHVPSSTVAPRKSEPAVTLENALPASHVLTVMSRHAVSPIVSLYLPTAHTVHVPSSCVDPVPTPAVALLYPWPLGHVVVDMSRHAVAPEPGLNFPSGHAVHVPSLRPDPSKFGVVDDSLLKPSPGPHVFCAGEVMAIHLSSLDEDAALYLPAEQRSHRLFALFCSRPASQMQPSMDLTKLPESVACATLDPSGQLVHCAFSTRGLNWLAGQNLHGLALSVASYRYPAPHLQSDNEVDPMFSVSPSAGH